MPTTPLRPCPVPGCAELVPRGRCRRHAKTTTQRGYGQAWRGSRRAVLQDEPVCRVCAAAVRAGLTGARLELARDVDHVTPKDRGGTDDRGNLQPLCPAHHQAKTARERAEREGRAP